MLDVANDRIEECIREVEKRDVIIERQISEYNLLEDLNKSLKADLKKERRKGVWKDIKTVGAFIIGAGLGYLGANSLN
jgi:hypothetical protein